MLQKLQSFCNFDTSLQNSFLFKLRKMSPTGIITSGTIAIISAITIIYKQKICKFVNNIENL